LVRGEYLVSDQGDDGQTVGARREFLNAARQVFPTFFEQLRENVYPQYALRAGNNPGYWHSGWKFQTWQLSSDRDNQLTRLLLRWARQFHAEEEWLLEGALQTLSLWHAYPQDRETLDVRGFYASVGGPVLIGDDEQRFEFQDWGWDPQSSRWSISCDGSAGEKPAAESLEPTLRNSLLTGLEQAARAYGGAIPCSYSSN